MKNFSLLHSRVGSLAQRLMVMFCVLMLGTTQVWATSDYSKNDSWNFAKSTGNSNWNGTGGSYCGGYGQKSSTWYISKNNISNFSEVDFSKHENVSLTIYVSAGTNGGTNSYIVKLIDSNGNQVSTYSETKTNGFASSQNGQPTVSESYVSFSPTTAFAGYKVEFPSKSYMTQTRYVLTYDNKSVSCSNEISLSKVVSGNGSFNVYQGTATGTEVENSGSIDNCGDGTTTLVVVPTPNNDDYYCSAVTASGSEDVEEDSDGNWVITYNQGSTINTTVTATFSIVPSYDVTWTANGGEHAKTSVKKGNRPTFPAAPVSTDAKSKQFVGWATSTWDNPLDDVSSKTIYTYGDAMPAVNGEVEYFAVWAKSTDTYAIMEYGDELTDGNYVFAAYASSKDYAMGNTVSSNMIAGTYIPVSSNEIEEPEAQFIWKLSHIDGTYISLYNAAATTNHYLGLTSSGLTLEANPSTNGQFNPDLSNTSNLATIALKSKSQTGKEIQYYNGNFKSYTSQSSNIYIYKEILEKYITTCASCNVSPSLGNPTLTSIASGKITVGCPSIGAGSAACEITDYGFIWKKGSAPTMESKDGIESTGTNDQSSAYSDDLTIDVANNTGSTYYIKAYATNGNGTTLSSALEVTPQSVTFSMNGHGSQVATQYVNNGGTATDPGTTSITGYTFNGWKLNSSAYSFSSAVTSDITLVADWSVKSHTLTWTTTGDALTGDYTGKSGDVDYGTTIVAPNTPTKTGYTFAAWTPAVAPTMPDNDLTYTATWTAKTTAITLNKNNEDAEGSNAGSASWTYDKTTKNSYSTPTRTGYTVEGYYTAASGGTKILNADGSLAGNAITIDEIVYTNDGKWAYNGTELTLYAHWTANTYKVVFKANGGTGDDVEQTGFTYDESKTLTSLETIGFTAPEHKYFLGWSKLNSATEPTYGDEESVSNLTSTNNGSVNLYAIWKAHTYTNYRTLCCTPLAAPANIAVNVTGAATATVTWDAVADATGYEYKLGDGEWTDTEIAGNAANPELSLSGLTGATNYTIYVRTNGSGDNCAEGTASAGTNFRTLSTVTAAVNDPLMGTAKVSLNNSDWYDAVETTDGTTIYLQATPGSLYDFSNWATPSSGTINNNQLTGWSGDVTVTANFVAKELTKLGTPTGMGLVGEPGATSATIKWNAVDHASGYDVVCDGATIGDVTVTDGVASCPLTLLTANTTYNWTVTALGDGISFEDGDACASQSFTTDKKKPTAIEITHAPTVTEYLEGESFATAGMVVKVTYNNGYIDGAYSDYTIDPSGALEFGTTYVTVTASLNEVSVSTTQAITVHKKYTLTFKNNGSIVETKNLKEGDAYGTFPSAGGACDGTSTTFMGWSTAEISEKQSTAPAEGYASPTDVMGTSNVILNAVWAKQTGQSGYKLVSAPTSGKKYVFVSSNAAGSAYAVAATSVSTSTTSGTKAASAPVTISSGTPVYISTVNENLEFAFDGSDYEIVGTLASYTERKYLHINGSYVGRRTASDANIMWDSDKGLYGQNGDKDKNYYLYLNSTVFDKAESPAEGARVYAFEKQEASYTDYLTTCCEEWSVTASYGEGNVISVSDGAVAVTLSDLAYGTASYESSDEDVLTVASDGKITGKKAGSATVTIAWAGIPGSKCAYETTVDVTVNGPITVTYNANDGSLDPETTSQNATSNSAFTLDANSFSRTGYTFQGWATTPSGDKAYNDSQADVEFAEDVTLYAVWSINSHAVTLTQPTGNTITATGAADLTSVDFGTSITLTATENDGYVFTGWSTEDVVLANTNPVVFTMPDNDVTVTATYSTYTWNFVNYTVAPTPGTVYTDADQFDKSAYTVKANYKRSDTEEPKAVDLAANAWTVKLNGTAIADDYEFAAGDDGKELAFYVEETKVWYSNITVTEVDKDRFIDNLWGNATIVKKEANYTVPTLTQTPGNAGSCNDHNVFIGWVLADDADNPTDDNKVVGGTTGQTPTNKTYYAIWAEHYSGNKDFDASKTSFASGDEGSSSSVSINTDISYTTAQNGGTSGPAISGTKLRLYRKNSGDYVGGYITISAVSGATISEVEFEVSSTNAVKYKAGTYSAGNMSDVAITDGKVTISELSATKFTLANADKDHQLDISSITVAYSKHVEEDRDYITDCDPRYDVEFNVGTSVTGSYDKVTKKAGVEITLPDGSALSKEHHTFKGWTEDAEGEGYLYTTTYTVPSENKTLYAQWDEDHHAFVHFMNGENEVAGSPIKVYDGGTFDLLGAQTAGGKAFIGWMWNGNKYKEGQTSQQIGNPAEDRTYTATWMPIIDVATANTADLSDGKWILVQNKSQLKAGDFIVIAAAGYDVAMSNYQKNSNRAEAAVTKNNDTLSYTSNVAPLFLQYDPENDYYAFYDRAYSTTSGGATNNSGYLYSDNNLKTQASVNGFQGVWSINITDKKASIVAQGNNQERIMRYNAASNAKLFSVYENVTQQDLAIYKWHRVLESGETNLSDIELTDAVIVKNGATLTVDAASSLVDLTVEAGGKVETTNELTVNNLTINSEAGKSGQVSNAGKVHANNVYMDVTFYKTAEILDATSANQWYMISAPFDVNLADGFTLTDGTPMRFAQSGDAGSYIFDLFEYDGAKRASTGNTGWKRVQGHMPAGKACLIGFVSGQPTTIRLKAANATLAEKASIALNEYSGDAQNRNWNGVANPNLHYININKDVQIYNNEEGENGRKYLPYTASTYSFVVGTAFFVQETGSISLSSATNGLLRAPKRESERYEACVRIVRDGAETFADQMFVRASEEASNEYEQGHDMITWNGTTAKTALIWSNNYGKRLAIEEAPIVDNKASYALSLYAPADGTYRIETPTESEEATLYLTKDGRVMWNLSMSACEVELTKGTTESYGLLLVRKAPGVATGMENVQSDDVQCTKVIIDNQVFILRGGQMYDVTGKAVK